MGYYLQRCTNMQIRGDDMKIGYYPILDMLLGVRHLYCSERYYSIPPALQGIRDKLDSSQMDMIFKIGEKTGGWLTVIETVIKLIVDGIGSPEEILLYLQNNYSVISWGELADLQKKEAALFLINMWEAFFSVEAARNSKTMIGKVQEIYKNVEAKGVLDFLNECSDRTVKLDENTMKIMIKPERIVDFSQVNNVILTPSLFTSRKMMFWNNGLNYAFYISFESVDDESLEPPDMILLKTLALNDKTRFKMLKIISSGSCSAMEISQRLNLNPSTVSRHLKLFKDAGFVDVFNQDGNMVYYSINIDEIKKTFDIILNYL
jgi:DNA-binding transcriptional ArsR family regulator